MESIVELCLQIEYAFQTKFIDAGYALIEQFAFALDDLHAVAYFSSEQSGTLQRLLRVLQAHLAEHDDEGVAQLFGQTFISFFNNQNLAN